jgi:hypothetical protein
MVDDGTSRLSPFLPLLPWLKWCPRPRHLHLLRPLLSPLLGGDATRSLSRPPAAASENRYLVEIDDLTMMHGVVNDPLCALRHGRGNRQPKVERDTDFTTQSNYAAGHGSHKGTSAWDALLSPPMASTG